MYYSLEKQHNMENKTKTYMLIGFFVVAIIIAFAIYKAIGSSKDVNNITPSNQVTTNTSTGLGNLLSHLPPLHFFGL